jgi:hypothetical protein
VTLVSPMLIGAPNKARGRSAQPASIVRAEGRQAIPRFDPGTLLNQCRLQNKETHRRGWLPAKEKFFEHKTSARNSLRRIMASDRVGRRGVGEGGKGGGKRRSVPCCGSRGFGEAHMHTQGTFEYSSFIGLFKAEAMKEVDSCPSGS